MINSILNKPNIEDNNSIAEWLISIADEYNYHYLALLANIDTNSMKLLVNMLVEKNLEIGELIGLGSGSYTETKDFVNSIIIRNRSLFNAKDTNNKYEYWMRFLESSNILKELYKSESLIENTGIDLLKIALDTSRISLTDAQSQFELALANACNKSNILSYANFIADCGLFNNGLINLFTDTDKLNFYITINYTSPIINNSPSFIKLILDSNYNFNYCKNHVYALIGDLSAHQYETDDELKEILENKMEVIINREFKFFTGIKRGLLLLRVYSDILKYKNIESEYTPLIDNTFLFRKNYRSFINSLVEECNKTIPLISLYSA